MSEANGQSSVLGQPMRIIDGREKITGNARYTHDLKLPGMLHARLVPSLYAHANLRGIDASAALARDGVVAVLTAADMPEIEPSSRYLLLLARDRVIFVGQPVAIVLAENEGAAEDGASLVDVDYEPLPAAMNIDVALAEGAPLVWPTGVPGLDAAAAEAHGATVAEGEEEAAAPSNLAGETIMERGDLAAGFAEAEYIVERTFETPMVHQNSLETHAVICQPDPLTGGMRIWASTQAPFGIRQIVAPLLGVPESDVHVTPATVGGAFGAKFGLYEPLVALASQAVGRPVRLALTRSEELAATNPAPPMRQHIKFGARADGQLCALDAEIWVESGCFPFGLGGLISLMVGSFYPVEHARVAAWEVLSFKQSTGAYRAPGATAVIYALDTVIDELAILQGEDPIEYRLRHCARQGQPMMNGNPWESLGMAETLEALRDHPAWQGREAARAGGRGIGISVGGWMGATEPAAAVCQLNRDGLLHVHAGAVDISGTNTGFALLAAEAFGIEPDKVRVLTGNTSHAPYSGGSGGSKVTYNTGAAIHQAAQAARQQVLEVAANQFEAAPEDLEIVDGAVRVRGVPDQSISLSKIAGGGMRFGGKHPPIQANGRIAVTDLSPAFSAQLAEVSVDEDTGEVTLHRLVIVQDVGRALNPAAIGGQMMGGAVQGIGWALHENLAYDEGGQLIAGSWMDYSVPDVLQVAPDLDVVIIEVPSEHGVLGVRGVGEAPVVPTPAAIANAIADVSGARMTTLPITAPSLRDALHDGGNG